MAAPRRGSMQPCAAPFTQNRDDAHNCPPVTSLLPGSAILSTMNSLPPPVISSFVIRFIVEAPAQTQPDQPPYHGSIRHVQSDATFNFNVWQDAVEFIRRYVPIEVAPPE